jgi:hypothetical protein
MLQIAVAEILQIVTTKMQQNATKCNKMQQNATICNKNATFLQQTCNRDCNKMQQGLQQNATKCNKMQQGLQQGLQQNATGTATGTATENSLSRDTFCGRSRFGRSLCNTHQNTLLRVTNHVVPVLST